MLRDRRGEEASASVRARTRALGSGDRDAERGASRNQSKGGASAAKRPRALTGQALRRRLIQTSPAHAVRTSSRAKVRRVLWLRRFIFPDLHSFSTVGFSDFIMFSYGEGSVRTVGRAASASCRVCARFCCAARFGTCCKEAASKEAGFDGGKAGRRLANGRSSTLATRRGTPGERGRRAYPPRDRRRRARAGLGIRRRAWQRRRCVAVLARGRRRAGARRASEGGELTRREAGVAGRAPRLGSGGGRGSAAAALLYSLDAGDAKARAGRARAAG